MEYPSIDEEIDIIDQNVEVRDVEEFETKEIIDLDDLQRAQETVKKVTITEELKEYILNISWATREPEENGIESGRFISNGASSRASIFMAYAGRANALMEGREYVTPEDVRKVAPHVLRHRIQLNYEGKSRNIRPEDIIEDVLETVPVV
ncbi:MAG: MoxR family ATPase [Candidatus Nanohaloarchaea archaeon]|nr:MoxR family ATPase [Candidatus Nanohaloarchaea archaeon]